MSFMSMTGQFAKTASAGDFSILPAPYLDIGKYDAAGIPPKIGTLPLLRDSSLWPAEPCGTAIYECPPDLTGTLRVMSETSHELLEVQATCLFNQIAGALPLDGVTQIVIYASDAPYTGENIFKYAHNDDTDLSFIASSEPSVFYPDLPPQICRDMLDDQRALTSQANTAYAIYRPNPGDITVFNKNHSHRSPGSNEISSGRRFTLMARAYMELDWMEARNKAGETRYMEQRYAMGGA